ncbi:DUF4435 domain-containing protein [Maridesulfovibrio sp.]|uniref:DUF4435 domain-containing protein n=1 Tax=Maridesulfovibrio sp. TaxID=2795000 RepID=UPI0029CA97BA|nr:AAA family ATPase [Maridesulfovibrio sp.]
MALINRNSEENIYSRQLQLIENQVRGVDLSEIHGVSKYDLDEVLEQLPQLSESSKMKTQISENLQQLSNCLAVGFDLGNIKFNHVFDRLKVFVELYRLFGDFSQNIVAVGANGSGKTSLAELLQKLIDGAGVIVSAQRLLNVNNILTLRSLDNVTSALTHLQLTSVTTKIENYENALKLECPTLLEKMLAEHIKELQHYRKSGEKKETLAERTISLWNDLFPHRCFECMGTDFQISTLAGDTYPLISMSDGEKVVLYLIAQVLLAPKDGFVIIDEPEIYLHRSIVNKLWNKIENERDDCKFIYLTHDLNFACSRTNVTKVWIKRCIPDVTWEIEPIPDSELPEQLLLEVLGSREKILFCEGKKGSYDENIYGVLFPNFKIIPVGSCTEVIHYTKSLNRIESVTSKAYGIIDADFHSEERKLKLKGEGIYSIGVAEPENLFLDEDFLNLLAPKIMAPIDVIGEMKDAVIKAYSDGKVFQATRFVTTKINNIFEEANVEKGRDVDEIESKFQQFSDSVEIRKWYDERITEIEGIVSEKDYEMVLAKFNNKGLKKIAKDYFKITSFRDRALSLLRESTEAQKALLKHFPAELTDG